MIDLKRILLIEDSPNDVTLILAAFEEIGLANEIVVMRDGQEALDFLYPDGLPRRSDELPVVALLDIKLPRVDGLEVLARVKGDPALKVLPVVMLTSSREESDLIRSYGLGVNAYVVKPVSFPDFVSALRELGLFWAVVNRPPPGFPARNTPV